MCCYSLQLLWQGESKKFQPFQALAWTDSLSLPADCQRGMQIACPPSTRMPLNDRTLPLGFEIRGPHILSEYIEQPLRGNKSPPGVLVPLFNLPLRFSITFCGILNFWYQASIPVTLYPCQAKKNVFGDSYFAASHFR